MEAKDTQHRSREGGQRSRGGSQMLTRVYTIRRQAEEGGREEAEGTNSGYKGGTGDYRRREGESKGKG
jgi:hypothetical protein